jgi:hypothetical protein
VDLLEPAHHERVRGRAGEAETLPAWCCTAPELSARGADRVLTPGWHFVARADERGEPGSDLAIDPVPGPVLDSCRHAVHRLTNGVRDQGLDGPGRRRRVVAG